MNNKIIKKITATLAILLLFILVISCPVTNNTKEDPSAVIEPQAPVYLLLLEQNDATETATKALYYDRALYKWGKSYSPSRGIYNELSVSDKISVPKKVVQVSFDIPYSGDSTTFDNKATYEAPFAGYYLYSKDGVSEEREFINEEGLLVDNIRDEGFFSPESDFTLSGLISNVTLCSFLGGTTDEVCSLNERSLYHFPSL